MKRNPEVFYFALAREKMDDMGVHTVLDMLRYEGARPLANGPEGWWCFQKFLSQPVTVERLWSFGFKPEDVKTYSDRQEPNGSVPFEFRDHLTAVMKTRKLAAHV